MEAKTETKQATEVVTVGNRLYDSALTAIDDNYLNPARFDQIWRIANSFAASDLVPDHFKGKPANCFIAIQMAFRANIDPMIALQNIYIVHGKPGLESKLAIAMANTSGRLNGSISYEEKGTPGQPDFVVTAKAETEYDEPISATVSMADAIAAGWTKNQAYKTMPALMLRYRAAMFLIRTHLPEVVFGMQTKEEIEDVIAAKNVTPVQVSLPPPPQPESDDVPFGEPTKKVVRSRRSSNQAEASASNNGAVTQPVEASAIPAPPAETKKEAPALGKPYAIIEKLLAGNGNTPVTKAFLEKLSGRRLEDADHLTIPQATRECNNGNVKLMQQLLDLRQEPIAW